MTAADWKRVKTIVSGALAESPETRPAYLETQCAGDPGLRREVESMLAAADSAADLYEEASIRVHGGTLTVPLGGMIAGLLDADAAAHAIPGPAMVGRRVGPYRIVREIGRGGMGSVYLAERADEEFRQRVALKVAASSRSPSSLKWFRHERQILASLEHPNIARLLDGGTTEDGIPYLVMEYVEGTPIDRYCAERRLTIDQRLVLFRTVCSAVQYAHRNLVVHRDLKPGNILVVDGVPKLLDFGIARLLAGGEDEDAEAAEAGRRTAGLMTPEYASPEQIRGGAITTATDVFTLGVLLYRLLTDRSPYQTVPADPAALARAVCEEEPRPPSTSVDDPTRRRKLAGDLDAIVLKALRKDPAARYATVAQMAEDIDRHRARLPIAGREKSVAYTAGKFVQRHRLAVLAAVVILATLLAGLGATLWQARRAEEQRVRAQRHFDDVRQLANSLIFEVHDGIESLPGTIPMRQRLVQRAVEYFDSLAAEERDDVGLQRELAGAYDKLGNVLGRPYAANLGSTATALGSYRKALAIRERIAEALPADRRAQLDLWSSYVNVGDLLRETADTAGALKLHEDAHAILATLLRSAPDDRALLQSAARTASTLCITYAQVGRVGDAATAALEAVAFDERLLAGDPGNNALKQDLASVEGRVGLMLLKQGDGVSAEPHFQRGFDLATALVAADPVNAVFKRRLSNGHSHFSLLLARRGELDAAWTHQQQALALRQDLVTRSPDDRQASTDLMVSEIETGDVLVRRREMAAAGEHYANAVTRGESLVADNPEYVYYRLELASALTRQAQTLTARGRAQEAIPLARRAIEITEKAAAADASDVRLRFETALGDEAMGDALAAARQPAQGWYLRGLQILDDLQRAGTLPGGTLNGDEPATLASMQRKAAAPKSAHGETF